MADFSDIQFLAGQLDYIARLNALRVRAEATLTEIENARNGSSSLLAQILAHTTPAEVDAQIAAVAVLRSGLTQNFNAGGFRINSLADPVQPQDGATRAWVLSQITLGADPTGVPVTSLNVGTMANGELLRRNGTALQGVAQSALPVTGFAVGGLQDGEFLARSGTNLVGRRVSSARPYFFSSF